MEGDVDGVGVVGAVGEPGRMGRCVRATGRGRSRVRVPPRCACRCASFRVRGPQGGPVRVESAITRNHYAGSKKFFGGRSETVFRTATACGGTLPERGGYGGSAAGQARPSEVPGPRIHQQIRDDGHERPNPAPGGHRPREGVLPGPLHSWICPYGRARPVLSRPAPSDGVPLSPPSVPGRRPPSPRLLRPPPRRPARTSSTRTRDPPLSRAG